MHNSLVYVEIGREQGAGSWETVSARNFELET